MFVLSPVYAGGSGLVLFKSYLEFSLLYGGTSAGQTHGATPEQGRVPVTEQKCSYVLMVSGTYYHCCLRWGLVYARLTSDSRFS